MKLKLYHFVILGSIVLLLDILKPLEYNDWIVYCFLIGFASKFCQKKDLYILALTYSAFIVLAFLLANNYESQAVQTHIRGTIMLWFLTYLLTKLRTEQHREEKLRKEHESIYNRIDEIIFGMDKNWRVTYKNAAADKMGYSFVSVGDNFFEKMPKTVGTNLELNLKKAMASQKPVTFTYETQYSLSPRTVIFSAYPSEEGLSVFTKDITELQEAQKKIEEANERIISIINRMNDAFWAVDRDFNIIYANDKMIKWAAKSKEELVGKNLWEVFPLLRDSVVEEKFKESINTQQPLKFEMKSIYIPNKFMSISITPSEEGLTIYAQDISEYKDTKIKLQQALEEKNVLLKELHHRVKNSLQIVSSIINLELDKMEDYQAKSVMSDIVKRIQSISLVHTKLNEAESLSHLNSADYIRELVNYLVRSYQRSDLNVKMDLGDVPIDYRYATPIGMIVNELVSNSIKYACRVGSDCEIHIACFQENGKVKLIIKDNGQGYPESTADIQTFGIQLVKYFAEQIEANFIMENRDGAYNEFVFKYQ